VTRLAVLGGACLAAVGVLAGAGEPVVLLITDAEGAPVVGATVCYVKGDVARTCGFSGFDGRYTAEKGGLDTMRITATGFLPATVSLVAQQGPVVLQRAPTLLVRLIDDTTEQPIAEGQVFVVYPNGRRKGPFPSNRAGVRIRRVLEPGEAIVVVEVAGYRQKGQARVELSGGVETRLDIRLVPAR
jgi:hypothetical protein